MRRVVLALLVGMLVSVAPRASAQEVDSRAALWTAAVVQKDLSKKWRLALRPELRAVEREAPTPLVGVSGRFRPWSWLALRAAYRFSAEANEEPWATNRFHVDAQGRLKFGRWTPALRLRGTYHAGPFDEGETRLRPRFALSLAAHKTLRLRVVGETFFDPREVEFRKMRYGGDVSYRVSKTKRVEQFIRAGYRLDYFLLKSKNIHIIQSSYKVAF